MTKPAWDLAVTDAPDVLARWCRRQGDGIPHEVVDLGSPWSADTPRATTTRRTGQSALGLFRCLSEGEMARVAAESLRHADHACLVIFRGLARGSALDALLGALAAEGLSPTGVRRAKAGALHGVDVRLARGVDPLGSTAVLLRIADLTAEWVPRSLARPRVAAHGAIGSWGQGLSWCSAVDPSWAEDSETLNRTAPDVIAVSGHAPAEIRRAVAAARSSGVPVVAFEPPGGAWDGAADHHEHGLDPLILGAKRTPTSPEVRRRHADHPDADRALIGAATGNPSMLADDHADLRPLLGERLTDLLASGPDADDSVSTARWKARVRRIALLEHGLAVRWAHIARAVGGWGLPIAVSAPPRVSLVIVAPNIQELERLLVMAHGQRYENLETILVTPRPSARIDADVVIVQDDGESLVAALERACRAATGELMALFHNGWYGAHYVTDLVLAHAEHASTLIVKAPSFMYAVEDDQTHFTDERPALWRAFRAGSFVVERNAVLATGWRRDAHDPIQALYEDLRTGGASAHVDHPFGRVATIESVRGSEAAGAVTATWTGLRLDVADADMPQPRGPSD